MAHLFSKEESEFIKNNVKGKSTFDLTEIFNKEFKSNIKRSQIRTYMKNHNIKNGLRGCFQKGHIPMNKGTKGLTSANKTSFKKGQKPVNHKPVGSERIDVEGFVLIKVAEPSVWKFKHRVLWEKANGKIPRGSAIIFLDGNRQNLDINNLAIVTKRQILEMMRSRLFSSSSEITKTGVIISELNIKIREKIKEE